MRMTWIIGNNCHRVDVKNASDNLMYLINASDLHHPIICMTYVGTPAAANAEAPPLRSEWVDMVMTPGKHADNSDATWFWVRNLPLVNTKRGPWMAGREDKNATIAMNGHNGWFVAENLTLMPSRNGSVLEALREIAMMRMWKFMVTSLTHKSVSGSKVVAVLVIYSDTLSKSKNTVKITAIIIRPSCKLHCVLTYFEI